MARLTAQPVAAGIKGLGCERLTVGASRRWGIIK